MCTRPLALSVLVGSVVFACGSRTDLIGSPSATIGDASTTDATAPQDAGSRLDATATVDAGAMPEGGSSVDEAVCNVARIVPTFTMGGCGVSFPPNNPCGPSEYQVFCANGLGVVQSTDECVVPNNHPSRYFCCPCLGADAGILLEAGDRLTTVNTPNSGGTLETLDSGEVCVNVDVLTYDRSCRGDLDCIAIQGGMVCSGSCDCGNATINVDGRARYEQTIAPVQLNNNCNCPQEGAFCIQGVCRGQPPVRDQ